MATRSNIAYKTPEGKIRSVYCHWDGYPEHNGEMLKRHYNSFDRAVALVELGSISALKPNLNAQTAGHSFETPADEITIAYHRDRGEELHISEYDDIPSWIADMEEYAYLYTDNGWIVNDHGKEQGGFPVFDYVEIAQSAEVMKNMGWDEA
tara:strand:+ start:3207 stop:3659 length:453 start_codon:yes stop_codon:yes gene_type:complete